MSTVFIAYGKKETDWLKSRDASLGAAIERIGKIQRRVEPDVFASLVSSIISQQVSTAAAASIKARLLARLGTFTPGNIDGVSLEEIQACGMSFRKASYIKGIARAALDGSVNFETLHTMPDALVTKSLCALKGVGEWTAEMLLIHALRRPDILSFKDLGIRRGMMRLYGIPEPDRSVFEEYRKLYSPYGTVASIYLWAVAAE